MVQLYSNCIGGRRDGGGGGGGANITITFLKIIIKKNKQNAFARITFRKIKDRELIFFIWP